MITAATGAFLILSVAYVAGVGVANGQPDSPAVREAAAPPPQDAEPRGMHNLTIAEREAALAPLPPEDRAGLAEIFDLAAADRMPVLDWEGNVRGVITGEAMYGEDVYSAADLYEVHGENGEVTGYWGGDLGFVEIEVARSEDFDPNEIRANLGTRSFSIDESGREHPL
jgi:hypothetical protein